MAVDLKAMSHKQLGDLIEKATARQEELGREKVTKLRDRIHALVTAEGLNLDEVLGRQIPRGKTRTKVKPKYRNPDNSAQTWSGRGMRPHWFRAAIEGGRTEQELLIA